MFDNQNIRTRYSRTLQKIRDFLLSKRSREFLIFLFFVFVSFCFCFRFLMTNMKQS